MKDYITYIRYYKIFENDDENIIIDKLNELNKSNKLNLININNHIVDILKKSNKFLHKIYILFNKNILLNDYDKKSQYFYQDKYIVEFYERINKIDDLIKKYEKNTIKLAIIYHFSTKDIYNKIIKKLNVKDKGSFLLFYSSITNKIDDKIFNHIKKDKDYLNISEYQKTAISKRLGDKYRSYFFKNITISQYINSTQKIDINIIINLLKKLNENKLESTLKKLLINKNIDLYNMNRIFIHIKKQLNKEIAENIMKHIIHYIEYYHRNMTIINILLSYNIDLLEIIYNNYNEYNFFYSYKNINSSYNADLYYKKLIKLVKIWNNTPLDKFINNTYILKILNEKFPRKFDEKYKEYIKNKKVKKFNL